MAEINSFSNPTYFNNSVTFYKDITIGGQLKYDELSLVRLTVTDKITAGIVTATTYYGDGSNLEVDGSSLSESISNSVPAGTVIYSASSTVPDGYIKANGAELLKTAYSDLYDGIGTTYGETDGNGGTGTSHFRVPDLRGEFIRGWDDSAGVDSGRTFGSSQTNSTALPNNPFGTDDPGDHTHGYSILQYVASITDDGPDQHSLYDTFTGATTGGGGAHEHTIDGGDDETRPRNIALLACIKY